MDSSMLVEALRAVKSGEVDRYEEIVEAYQQRIFLYCYHMLLDRMEAEDATQEIFIKAFYHLPHYQEQQNFNAWLYKIAYHYNINKLRRRKAKEQVHRLLAFTNSQHTGAADHRIERLELGETLIQLLQQLSHEERSLIILRVVEERTYEEIGEILNREAAYLRKKYERARKKLQTILLEREGVDYESFAKLT